MVSLAGSRWLAGVTLAYCLGGAGAFIEDSADGVVSDSLEDSLVLESFLFQRGVRGYSSDFARHGAADRALPQWSRDAPTSRAQLIGAQRHARGRAVSEDYSDYPGESVADWISRRLGIEADERVAQEPRSRSSASGAFRSNERRAQGHSRKEGAAEGWSPCKLGAELPCSYWTEAYSCSTTWSQACPGVDNPAGPQYNDAEIGTACPAQCGKAAGALAPESPQAVAHAGGQTHLYPALCNLTKLASCSMWASAYPSCGVTWAEACPGVDNPSGAQYNTMTVQQSCPRQCAEKAAAKACIGTDNGATDAGDYDCKLGYTLPNYCGFYDDTDFTAEEMCCECGGGGFLEHGPRGATQPEQPEEPEESPAPPLAPTHLFPPPQPEQPAPPPAPAAPQVPPTASAALLSRAAAGDKKMMVSSTAAFATGDMVTIAGGAVSETITIYLSDSEPLYLQVKAGLQSAYPVGSIITEKVPAKTYWCHDQMQFDCGVWAGSFPCTYSYSVVCPGKDSPYGSALNGVALSMMCPSECGLPKATPPVPEAPKPADPPSTAEATTSSTTTASASVATTAAFPTFPIAETTTAALATFPIAETTTAALPTPPATPAGLPTFPIGERVAPEHVAEPEAPGISGAVPRGAGGISGGSPEANATAPVPLVAVPESQLEGLEATNAPAQWAWISNFRMAHNKPLPSVSAGIVASHAVYMGTARSHAEAERLVQASSKGPFVALNWHRPGAGEDSSVDGALYGLTTQDGWQGEGDQIHDTALRVDISQGGGAYEMLSTRSRGSSADKKASDFSAVLELSGGQEKSDQSAAQVESLVGKARSSVLDFDTAEQESSVRAKRRSAAKSGEARDAQGGEDEAAADEKAAAAEEAGGEVSHTEEEAEGESDKDEQESEEETEVEAVDKAQADKDKEDTATEEAAMQVAALAEAVIVDVDSDKTAKGTAKGKAKKAAEEIVNEAGDEAEERTDETADEEADEKSDETAEEDSEAEGSTADEAEESRTAIDSDSDETDSSEESANADASDTQEAKGSEAQEDDQKDVAGKRTTLASVSDVERLEAQAEFLTEQIKSLDDSVDRFFTRVQKRVTFFKDQAVARSRRSCVPDKEKLSTFEFDITNAMNATFKDWSVVLRAFDSFGKQLRNLEGFGSSDRASFQEQASELAEELKLMTPEDSEHCNFRTLHKDVLSLGKAPLSLASVKLTQFRQAFFGCQELIDADLDQFFGALEAFAGRLSGAGEAVPDAPARLMKRSGEIIRGLNDEAVTLSFKIHDAFFQFSQVVERAVDGARPTMKRCGSSHHRK